MARNKFIVVNAPSDRPAFFYSLFLSPPRYLSTGFVNPLFWFCFFFYPLGPLLLSSEKKGGGREKGVRQQRSGIVDFACKLVLNRMYEGRRESRPLRASLFVFPSSAPLSQRGSRRLESQRPDRESAPPGSGHCGWWFSALMFWCVWQTRMSPATAGETSGRWFLARPSRRIMAFRTCAH